MESKKQMDPKTKFTETVAAANEAAVAATNRNVDQTVTTLKEGTAKAVSGLENTQGKIKEGVDRFMRTAEELVQFNQGNFEAFVKSSQIWAAGVQDLTKQAAASAQVSFEETVSTYKALSSVRSVREALELQANLARSSVEKVVAESGRLADASVKLAEKALAPLTARVTLAAEKFAKSA
jgi:phasin family protein